jgi:hypothetical protein
LVVNHWLNFKTGKPFVPDLEQFGFVYIITNLKTEKKYIGCKQSQTVQDQGQKVYLF